MLFSPSIEGYCNLFTTRSRQTPEYVAALPPAVDRCDQVARDAGMVVAGPSNYVPRFVNSLIIAFGSTALSVGLGVMAAYAFSRFKVPLKDDLLFFILSTRMMPPIAVAIPIYLMYRELGLSDTRLGMIVLYSAVNVSLAVWLLKGFIDEIPREYEEAAMVDGYTAAAGLPQGGAAAGDDGHRGDRDLLPHLRLERVRVRGAADLGNRADRAALHPDHHRRGRPGLAGGGGRHDVVPAADPGLHRPAAQAPAARHHVRRGPQMSADAPTVVVPPPPASVRPRWLRRDRMELVACAVIALGLAMMLQPIALVLYTWSFATILFGTAMFIVVSKFPD